MGAARIKKYEHALAHASTYAEWHEVALELDELTGANAWKAAPESADYDYELIRRRHHIIKEFREAENITQLIYHLREGLHRNLGNIGNPRLYQYSHTGTKYVIDDYISEVVKTLEYLCEVETPEFPFSEKLNFFQQTGHSYGRCALLLSGGASFGVFHFGVAKALWEQNLIPRVISGSSSGSVVTGILGSCTNSEIQHFFDNPGELYSDIWKRLDWKDALSQRSLMDSRQLETFIRENLGNFTFEEAFERTGRISNITVSPIGENQNSRLLNYLTFPHLFMWSASLASCAVPCLFPPVTLTAKSNQGTEIDYMPSIKWMDGTLTNDLPMARLGELYNVNYHIVSQTNPHVIPFISEPSIHQGPMALAKKIVRNEFEYRAREAVSLFRSSIKARLPRQILDEAYSVLDQSYYGDVTVYPEFSAKNYLKLLSNPSKKDTEAFILQGERATWPRMSMIRNETKISHTFERCIQYLKQQRHRRASDRSPV